VSLGDILVLFGVDLVAFPLLAWLLARFLG
jgi:hypothetical protein